MTSLRLLRALTVSIGLATLIGVAYAGPLGVKSIRRADVPGVGSQNVADARVLADGRIMVAVADTKRMVALVYDTTGRRVSTRILGDLLIQDGNLGTAAAIGPFGEVYTAFKTRVTKFDGYSGATVWDRTITPPSDLWQEKLLKIAPDGSLYFLWWGSQHEVMAVRLDEDGSEIWGPTKVSVGDPLAAVIDRSGNLTILSNRWNGDSTSRAWISRVSGATGDILWGPRQLVSGLSSERAISLALDGAGNAVATVLASEGGSDSTEVTYKIEGATGNVLWGPSFYRGGGSARPTALAVTLGGDSVVGGSTAENATLRKLDSASGNALWVERYPARGGRVESIAVDGMNAAYVVVSEGATDADILLRRIDLTTGSTLWGPVILGEPEVFESPSRILLDHDEGIVVLGEAASEASGYPSIADEDVILQRFDSRNGGALWPEVRRFRGAVTPTQADFEILEHPSGDLILSIDSYFFGFQGWQPSQWIRARFSADDGELVWGGAQRPPGSIKFGFAQSVIDSAGDLISAGRMSEDDLATGPYGIVKYRGSDGERVWGPIRVGAWKYASPHPALTVLPGGDIAAVVRNQNGMSLSRLAGADGRVVWGPLQISQQDDVVQLAPSPDGGLYVLRGNHLAGYSLSQRDAANGSLTWSSPLPYDSWAPRFWVDPTGNPLVEVSTTTGRVLLKYSGADGDDLWSKQPSVLDGSPGPSVLIFLANGDILMVGTVTKPQTFAHPFASRITPEGETVWVHEYPELAFSGVLDAARTEGETVAMLGSVQESISASTRDVFVLEIDPSAGETIRHEVFDFQDAENPRRILARDGDLVVVNSAYTSIELIRISSELLIDARSTREPLAAKLGHPFQHSFFASGGAAPYSWSTTSTVSARTLPSGVTLDGSSGLLHGTPLEEGEFHFNIRVRDGQGLVVETPVHLKVLPTRTFVLPAQPLATCIGRSITLHAGEHRAYEWFPTGEWTSTIQVSPSWPLLYGVHVTEADGTTMRGAVLVDVFSPCHSIDGITPPSGPAAGGFPFVIRGSEFDAPAKVRVGGIESPVVAQQSAEIETTAPALSAGALHDVAVTISGRTAVLRRAFFTEFTDVPSAHPFAPYIEGAVRSGLTAGCGGGRFCADDPLLRAHAAVFLLKAKYGSTYEPPPASGTRFADVPATAFAANFIENLAKEGISTGCAEGLFCPGSPVSRAQAAVLMLRTKHGSAYAPPPATGMFLDLEPGDPFAPWIEQLAREEITAGCGGGNFCPGEPVTRGQMMVFLGKAFVMP